jgi:hypothetical protein
MGTNINKQVTKEQINFNEAGLPGLAVFTSICCRHGFLLKLYNTLIMRKATSAQAIEYFVKKSSLLFSDEFKLLLLCCHM